jgi:hypothetical protein
MSWLSTCADGRAARSVRFRTGEGQGGAVAIGSRSGNLAAQMTAVGAGSAQAKGWSDAQDEGSCGAVELGRGRMKSYWGAEGEGGRGAVAQEYRVYWRLGGSPGAVPSASGLLEQARRVHRGAQVIWGAENSGEPDDVR